MITICKSNGGLRFAFWVDNNIDLTLALSIMGYKKIIFLKDMHAVDLKEFKYSDTNITTFELIPKPLQDKHPERTVQGDIYNVDVS